MKILVAILNHDMRDFSKPPYFDDEIRRKNYEFVGKYITGLDFDFARVSVYKYKGRGVFTSGWVYRNGWQYEKNIRPDIIINKSHSRYTEKVHKTMAPYIPIINHKQVEAICRSKLKTIQTFPSLTIQAYPVQTLTQLKAAIKKLPGDKVVLKPLSESSGRGIKVIQKNKLPRTIGKNMMVQEYFDASGGVPGIVKGVADLRVIVSNGEIAVVFVRIAKDGFFTNQSKKGTIRIIEKRQIPKVVLPIVKQVDKKFAPYGPRIYTVDFVFDKSGKPKIMELNASPSFNYQVIHRLDLLENILRELLRGIKKFVKS